MIASLASPKSNPGLTTTTLFGWAERASCFVIDVSSEPRGCALLRENSAREGSRITMLWPSVEFLDPTCTTTLPSLPLR